MKLPLLRRALVAVAVGILTVGAVACEPAPSSGSSGTSSSEAAQLQSLVNSYRAANGFPTLAQASDATAKAQQHADEMAASLSIYHSSSLSSGISPGWSAIGENVGVGGSVDQLESMFEASGVHRANMLNGAYNQIGVGATRGNDGRLYVTEIFVGR